MPINPQRIQAGKNDPKMFKEGSREQPVASNKAGDADIDAAARNVPGTPRVLILLIMPTGLSD
jgi:hypothetical protein